MEKVFYEDISKEKVIFSKVFLHVNFFLSSIGNEVD